MISWKNSFERLNEEFEITEKKRQALDNLLNAGRISQSTYELFNEKIDKAITELERQQKALLEKMKSKLAELGQHTKTLEMLLANFEIRHVTGEIEEEVYQREVSILSTGLEYARQELDTVKEAVDQLSNSIKILPPDTVTEHVMETQNVETPQPETAEVEETVSIVEPQENRQETQEQNLPEPPEEPVESGSTEYFQEQPEQEENPAEEWQDTEETQETWQNPEETQQTETATETEETQE